MIASNSNNDNNSQAGNSGTYPNLSECFCVRKAVLSNYIWFLVTVENSGRRFVAMVDSQSNPVYSKSLLS